MVNNHCVVVGCTSDSRKGLRTNFFHFPGQVRCQTQFKAWFAAVNRKEFTVKRHSVVCQLHFVDGKPTPAHPTPCLNMGYDRKIHKTRYRPWKPPQVTTAHSILKDSGNLISAAGASEATPEVHVPIPDYSAVLEGSTEEMDMEPNVDMINCFHSYVTLQEMPAELDSEQDSLIESIVEENNSDGEMQIDYEVASEGNSGEIHNHHKAQVNEQTSSKQNLPSESAEIASLRRKLLILRSKVQQQQKQRWSVKDITDDDGRTRFYTGFPTWKCFHTMFTRLFLKRARKLVLSNKKKKTPWYRQNTAKPGPTRKLQLEDEFLMTMMSLKLNLLEKDLADRFGVSQTTVSRVLNMWIPLLARKMKKLIVMPKAEKVKENLPKVFKTYPRTRVIIDCTEVFIQRSTNLLARQLTWSNYKHHNTAKALVGITPNGVVCTLSKMWGGRASDKHIVKNSGETFLDALEPYDQVMADRGFDIADLLAPKCVTLNIPPFTKGKTQLDQAEVQRHRKVSSLRIHVERAIERIKIFRVLQGVFPVSRIKQLDDIMTIICGVTNLLPPLVQDKD